MPYVDRMSCVLCNGHLRASIRLQWSRCSIWVARGWCHELFGVGLEKASERVTSQHAQATSIGPHVRPFHHFIPAFYDEYMLSFEFWELGNAKCAISRSQRLTAVICGERNVSMFET